MRTTKTKHPSIVDYSLDRVHTAMVRSMLAAMDISIKDQPAGADDRKALLEAISKQQHERFQQLYKIIVLGYQLDDLIQREPGVLAQSEISNHVRTTFSDFTYAQTEILKQSLSSHLAENRKDLNSMVEKHKADTIAATRAAIEEASKKFVTIKVKVGNKSAKTIAGTLPAEFKRMLQLAQARRNILLTGPAGCGKTFIAGKIAEALDLPFASQSCSEGMSESALVGTLLPTGSAGRFVYNQSEFVRIYENGGVFLFDEMDAADPNVMVFMNQALANEGFFLPQRVEKPYVKKHADFIAIAATNTFGNGADSMYVGRNQLDAATMDRFKIGTIKMSYDAAVEEAIIDPEILIWGRHVRELIVHNRLRRIMSTRVMRDASIMKVEQGWTLAEIKEGYFADWSRDELAMMRDVA
jgi:MoxR-like ATPase